MIGLLVPAGAVVVLAVLAWRCHRDAPKVLRYYAETGGDDLAIPPGPDLGVRSVRARGEGGASSPPAPP